MNKTPTKSESMEARMKKAAILHMQNVDGSVYDGVLWVAKDDMVRFMLDEIALALRRREEEIKEMIRGTNTYIDRDGDMALLASDLEETLSRLSSQDK